MMENSHEYRPGIFHGVYSYREAARLLGVSTQRVARWADGYVFKLKHELGKSKPVLKVSEHKKGALSFPELFELFFVKEYVALGVQLQHVRATAEALEKEVGSYPFTKKPLLLGGRELLIETSRGILKRPDIGQFVADYADWMLKQVKIDNEEVGRYYPSQFDEKIFLDKQIRAGEPVITDYAIPTRLIHSLWEKEKDPNVVAEYYDIQTKDVSLAIRYEGEWRLAA